MRSESDKMIDFVDEYHKKWWKHVYKQVSGAVVFIEDSLAECLHWDGGLFNLINAGAVGVKFLSSFEVNFVYQNYYSFSFGNNIFLITLISSVETKIKRKPCS